jgi:hypothetical protein
MTPVTRNLILILSFSSISLIASSQNKTATKANKTAKAIESILRPKPASTPASTGGSTADGAYNVLAGTGKTPGDIAPDAVFIDADYMSPFNQGAAVIRKGRATALIDKKGNFIIPFNKYEFNIIQPFFNVNKQPFFNGIITGIDLQDRQYVYLNPKGQIIVKGIEYRPADNNRLLYLSSSVKGGYQTLLVSQDGKRYTIASASNYQAITNIENGIGISQQHISSGPYAYRKISGEMITKYEFDEAYPFSEGLALVGKKNQYGELKYGFIDESGKPAIPYTFSKKPTHFSAGLSRIEPQNNSAFEYAYLNKKGEILFKQTLSDIKSSATFKPFTSYGWAFGNNSFYFLDTTLTPIPKETLLNSLGLPPGSFFINTSDIVEGDPEPKLQFQIQSNKNPATSMPRFGFINLVTKKIVAPFLDNSINHLYFDPISKLAYAEVILKRDAKHQFVYRKGYINEDGIFVIVMGEKSTW